MPRIIKVGSSGGCISLNQAIKDLQADDVIFLQPGFYELPQGVNLADITIKGTGVVPEDTTILGYIGIAEGSRFVTLENLCINTLTDNNSLYVPYDMDGYLSLRNCIVKTAATETAAIALNGKITLELYSTKIINGSVSIFADTDFRLEMNDSLIDYQSDDFCALAIEGRGTAIINNSEVRGSTNTFSSANIEFNINNSRLDSLALNGQTWLNLLNTEISSTEDTCMIISDRCWANIVGCQIKGGLSLENLTRVIMQNTIVDRLLALDQAKLTAFSCSILSHTDLQDHAWIDATRVNFSGNQSFEYYLALNKHSRLTGQDLILNANEAKIAVFDEANFRANVAASDQPDLEITSNQEPNVKIFGVSWSFKKD